MSAAAATAPAIAGLADVLFERFAGRRDAYSRRSWSAKTGRWEWWTARERKDAPNLPLTLDVIKRHVANKSEGDAIGVYLMEEGGEHVRFAAIDIDNGHGDNPALPWDELVRLVRPLYDTLTKFEDVLALRSGGGKGMHLVMLFDQPVRAAEIRAHLAWVLDQCGLREDRNSSGGIRDGVVEVFPKQNHAKGGKGFANLLALPFARQSVPLNADLEPLPIETAAEIVAAVPSYIFEAPPALRGAPASPAAPSPPPASRSQPAAAGGEAVNVVSIEKARRQRFDMAGAMQGIAEGGRDNGCWSMVCAFAASGVLIEAAETFTRDYCAKCSPPIPWEVGAEKLRRAYATYEPNIETTDSGNAEYFAAVHGNNVRFDHARKRWLIWEGHRWRPDVDGEINRLAAQTMRMLAKAAVDLPDANRAKAVTAHAIKSRNAKPLDSLLKLAQIQDAIREGGERWDREQWLLGVANGVIDLKKGELRPGRREDYITMQSPVSYDPEATCPRWESYLLEMYGGDAELVDFIQRFLGYSLTGNVEEEVVTFHHGGGKNGKSVLLKVLKKLLGDYAHTMNFTALEDFAKKSVPTEIAELVGKRLVVASEADDSAELNTARLKSLGSRDDQRARFLYARSFEFTPTQHYWLAFNHAPKVRDDTEGFWRRVALVPYEQYFRDAPADETAREPGAMYAEKKLDERLIAEELPGIFAWAVRGCLAWQDRGLKPFPSAVTKATQDYREAEDELAPWIEERCVLNDEFRAKPRELFENYKSWANLREIPMMQRLDERSFKIKMTSRYRRIAVKGNNFYRGIDLRATTGREIEENDGYPGPF